MPKILDTLHADTVAEVVLELLDDVGYTDYREAIPGLIQVILTLANGDDQVLDEAATFLADGSVE